MEEDRITNCLKGWIFCVLDQWRNMIPRYNQPTLIDDDMLSFHIIVRRSNFQAGTISITLKKKNNRNLTTTREMCYNPEVHAVVKWRCFANIIVKTTRHSQYHVFIYVYIMTNVAVKTTQLNWNIFQNNTFSHGNW